MARNASKISWSRRIECDATELFQPIEHMREVAWSF